MLSGCELAHACCRPALRERVGRVRSTCVYRVQCGLPVSLPAGSPYWVDPDYLPLQAQLMPPMPTLACHCTQLPPHPYRWFLLLSLPA